MAELWLNAWERVGELRGRAAHCLDAGCMLETAGTSIARSRISPPASRSSRSTNTPRTSSTTTRATCCGSRAATCRPSASPRRPARRPPAPQRHEPRQRARGDKAATPKRRCSSCAYRRARDPRAFHHLEDLAAEQRDALLRAWPDLDSRLAELRRRIEPRPATHRGRQSAPELSTTTSPNPPVAPTSTPRPRSTHTSPTLRRLARRVRPRARVRSSQLFGAALAHAAALALPDVRPARCPGAARVGPKPSNSTRSSSSRGASTASRSPTPATTPKPHAYLNALRPQHRRSRNARAAAPTSASSAPDRAQHPRHPQARDPLRRRHEEGEREAREAAAGRGREG